LITKYVKEGKNMNSDQEKEAVRQVIQKYSDGTFNGDAEALRECFHEKAVMNGYMQGNLLMGGPEPFIEEIEKNPSMAEGGAPYKGEIVSVDVDGMVASVTFKESGFAGTMKFTNYFHLLKEGDDWKIISKAFFQS
jgi:ketosteroid isomerase-like protein